MPRGVANGGLGVLLDGKGNDTYECDYFSHGGAYWFSAGFARDFERDDRCLGATRVAYDGGPRKDEQFLRWGLGYGCHFAEGGSSMMREMISTVVTSWVSRLPGILGVTAVCDFEGDDHYEIPSSGSALCAEVGLSILLDVSGDDHYLSADHDVARPGGGGRGNFAFALDYGETDHYANETFTNNGEFENGCRTSFIIDRPVIPSVSDLESIQEAPQTEGH